jgi:protein TonB
MAAERSGTRGIFSRSGPAIAVIGIHVLIVYGLIVSMGIVKMPKFAEPIEAVFIPEQTQDPEPEMKIKPQIDAPVAVNEPVPEVQYDEPVAPPSDTPIAESANAITAAPVNGAVAQDLKTSTRLDPTYPSASRRAGEEGTVRLKVLVDERGRPQQVQVAKGSGFERLDAAAIEAVKKWRFVAATDGTKAIQAWTQVAVTFKLTAA